MSQSLSCVKLRSVLWLRPCLVHVSGCRVPPLFSCCRSGDWLTSGQLLERGERCHWIVITVLFTLSTLVRAFRCALNKWVKSRLDRYTCSEMLYFLVYALSWLSVIFLIKIVLFMLLYTTWRLDMIQSFSKYGDNHVHWHSVIKNILNATEILHKRHPSIILWNNIKCLTIYNFTNSYTIIVLHFIFLFFLCYALLQSKKST